ncbi:unnamed protein product [Ciceribacter selenitireducens ATCC BAA-1503]|uniref:Uncharacterized protein n=1 Tax=Ciceribacter selenitireducens ATCC BAA-1503 TaxID=1336235 RepID=A0A376AE20_9HYPH|nr:unnamed protein product [Ciceribacter selenitireducens ATCC BAA-1503]
MDRPGQGEAWRRVCSACTVHYTGSCGRSGRCRAGGKACAKREHSAAGDPGHHRSLVVYHLPDQNMRRPHRSRKIGFGRFIVRHMLTIGPAKLILINAGSPAAFDCSVRREGGGS